MRRLKKLRSRKGRESEGLFVLEGIRLIADTPSECLEEVYVSEAAESDSLRSLVAGLLREGIPVFWLSSSLFDELAETVHSQGVLAVARVPTVSGHSFWEDTHSIVVCDAIQDPGNLGTLFRTAAGAGYDGIVLTDGTVDPYNPKSVRASMGSLFRIRHCTVSAETIGLELKQRGFRIIIGDVHASKSVYEADMSGDLAVVLGNEGAGPRACLIQNASEVVSIPLAGGLESLNVTVAAGILLFERVRQIRQAEW